MKETVQVYHFKFGGVEMELPSLNVEDFDQFTIINYLNLFMGDDGVKLLRERFLNAVATGDFQLVDKEVKP